MNPITRTEVISVLGAVDDALMAEIVGTGATQAELAEAHAWIMSDEALVNEGRPLPSGRVGDLVEILQSAEQFEPSSDADLP